MKLGTFQKLRKYEGWLTTAIRGNFIRSLTNTQVEELIVIGKEEGINHVNNHCPKCTLDFIKKLAVPYFEFKEKMENKKKEKEEKKDNE